MTTKKIQGVLADAAGVSIADATVRFVATSTRSIVNTVTTDFFTNALGAYSIEVLFGVYTIQIKRKEELQFRTVCANAYIYDSSVETLEAVIRAQGHIQEIDETLIQEMLSILAQTNASSAAAASSANTATTKAEEASDSALSAQNQAIIAQEQATIATDRASASATSALSSASYASAAATSASEADTFSDLANDSAQLAVASKEVASVKAQEAATSASNALVSQNSAEAAKQLATTASTTATTKAQEAASSATNAEEQALLATQNANTASEAAIEAHNSATISTTKASEALTSASAAEASAQVSSDKTAEASSSANTATQQAVIATSKAQESATSAAEAAQSAALAAGALLEAGSVDLSSGVYPTPIKDAQGNNRSCFWKVTIGGTAGGEVYGIGDSLVYSKELTGYYKIDNTESVTSVAGKQGIVTLNSSDVGLANVNNTSDLNKPISTATQNALDSKVPIIRKINGKTLSSDISITSSDTNSVEAANSNNWANSSAKNNVVGMLSWKNYGNGHTIFDASAGTSPDGTAVGNVNPEHNWSATYPTLMGWNGSATYGVRVDSARLADGAITADHITGIVSTNGQDLTIHSKRAMVGNNGGNQLIINYGNDWGSTLIQGHTYLQTVESNRHLVVHNGSTAYSNSGLEVRSTDGSDVRIGFHRAGYNAGAINFSSWGFHFEREAGSGSRANVVAANFFADSAQDTSGNALTRKDYVDGALSSKFDKTGGTISGDVVINTSPIRGANGAAIVKDHGNGNTTFSGSRTAAGTVGDLYLGYHDSTTHFTNKVILHRPMYAENTSTQIIDSANGALFDKGAAVIGANRDNVLNNSSFGVGFLSSADSGAQWIAGYFGKNGGSNQVVIGELQGGAVIGGHNAAKNAWAPLYINCHPNSGTTAPLVLSAPKVKLPDNNTLYDAWHSGNFNPDSKLSENGHYGGTLKLNNWFRSVGDSGWYNETYSGGIYMDEASTVKVYNGKKFSVANSENNSISSTGGIFSYQRFMVDTRQQIGNGGSFNAYRSIDAPFHAGHGGLDAGTFAPIVGSANYTNGQGYATRVHLGVRTVGADWTRAVLMVGSAESTAHPCATYEFDAYGNVAGITTLNSVNLVSSRTDGVTGLELRNTGGDPGLSFHRPNQSWAELRHDGTKYYMGGDGQNFTIGNDMICSYAYANGAQPLVPNALTRKDYVDSKASLSGATFSGNINVPTINGLALRYASDADTVAVRDSAGDITTRLLRSEYGDQSDISGAIAFRVNNSNDNYVRFCSNKTAIRSWLGVGAPLSGITNNQYTITTGAGLYASSWALAGEAVRRTVMLYWDGAHPAEENIGTTSVYSGLNVTITATGLITNFGNGSWVLEKVVKVV